jgi:hypothetical protein
VSRVGENLDCLQESRSRPAARIKITTQTDCRWKIRRGRSGNAGRADFPAAGYRPVNIAVIQVMMPISQGAISQNDSEE